MFSVDTETNEIFIYDEIGPAYWGLIDAKSVIEALNAMKGKRVTVRLNTPGGSVDEGVAMYNAMLRHKGGVDTVVDSLAASMGSYLLQAGENRRVAPNAKVMIHDPWSISIGNATTMRKDAETLDKYAISMIPAYSERSGKTQDEILSIMAEETWLAGQEIIDAGFADTLEDFAEAKSVKPVVSESLFRACAKMPQSLQELREANRAERLHDQLKVAGIDRRNLARDDARRMSARVAAICDWIK